MLPAVVGVARQSLIAFKGGAEHPRHFIAYEMETSPQTSNCVAASRNGQLMAGAFGKMVRVYAKNPSGFHKLAEFRVSLSDGLQTVQQLDRLCAVPGFLFALLIFVLNLLS